MTEAVAKGESVLLTQARDKFVAQFGREPVAAAAAPGRVNLIGEHALPFLTVVVGSYNNTNECNILSILANGDQLNASFSSSTELKPGEPAWANYVKGVVAKFPAQLNGFDAVIVSDVPMGSGVSSSASLEVAFFTFLEALVGMRVEPVKKALLCQKAEHDFPGMPCGIMDQFIVTMGKKDHALLIDCRSLESTQIAMDSSEAVILVVNSNVKHQLTGSEYPQRRAQCQEAAEKLKLPSLRSAKVEDLAEQVAQLLPQKDFVAVGNNFYKSHESLSKLMEVSCPELDQLVDILRPSPGVYGARMTGGGFGGCVIALVKRENVEDAKRKVLSQYKGKPDFFVCQPSDGARILKMI
uniref:Galactokinase-like protein n=1 Tax=Heliconius erato TaxID=33431 RepID=L7X3T9_HELEA|nr:galactokinase-like protein [Heliconius erato]